MSIRTDRDVFIGAHLTMEQKEAFRKEAERRNVSMSALVSFIIEEWLVQAPHEQIEVRSNKRNRLDIINKTEEQIKREEDVPLPFEK